MHCRPQPDLTRIDIDGTKLGAWHWPSQGESNTENANSRPPVLFVHATGFHARIWDEVVHNLPEDLDIWAFDMRGHGTSDKPDPPYLWKRFGADTAALAKYLKIRKAVAIGHSMGGHAVARAAALAPECFGGLILIDPIIFAKSAYKQTAESEHGVLRRKNHWSSRDEMFASFKDRKPFSSWDKKVLHDYCQYGLLKDSHSGDHLVLACPPRVEASIYSQSIHTSADIYSEIESIEIPVELLIPGAPEPGVEPELEKFFRRGHKTVLAEQTHFIPMEVPGKVATYIEASVAGLEANGAQNKDLSN
ncbi:MAG TPA: alpha/beta hydrolase, partial [Chroococcales cyanobacterium]